MTRVGVAVSVPIRPGETVEAVVERVHKTIREEEKAYSKTARSSETVAVVGTNETMGIGEALECCLNRHKIARLGWNGKGQYVTMIMAGNAMYQGCDMQDCLGLKNAQGNMQPGWLPSQGDIFAKDWVIVE